MLFLPLLLPSLIPMLVSPLTMCLTSASLGMGATAWFYESTKEPTPQLSTKKPEPIPITLPQTNNLIIGQHFVGNLVVNQYLNRTDQVTTFQELEHTNSAESTIIPWMIDHLKNTGEFCVKHPLIASAAGVLGGYLFINGRLLILEKQLQHSYWISQAHEFFKEESNSTTAYNKVSQLITQRFSQLINEPITASMLNTVLSEIQHDQSLVNTYIWYTDTLQKITQTCSMFNIINSWLSPFVSWTKLFDLIHINTEKLFRTDPELYQNCLRAQTELKSLAQLLQVTLKLNDH
jgi:hypothetical protein